MAAADFIAGDAELSALLAEWPRPRQCGPSTLRPIFIGIPESEVVGCVPRKRVAVQGGIRDPRRNGSAAEYLFGPAEEAEYKRAYRDAYFGATRRKAGWDCLRHYEIVASGAVPRFETDLAGCPELTLAFWPKRLLARLAGLEPDPRRLDADGLYAAAAAALLAFARLRLTTRALARYVLETSGHPGARSVLFLSAHPSPDYVRDMLLHGLKLTVPSVVDMIRPAHLYAPPWQQAPARGDDRSGANGLYGHGFSYA